MAVRSQRCGSCRHCESRDASHWRMRVRGWGRREGKKLTNFEFIECDLQVPV